MVINGHGVRWIAVELFGFWFYAILGVWGFGGCSLSAIHGAPYSRVSDVGSNPFQWISAIDEMYYCIELRMLDREQVPKALSDQQKV